MQFLLFLTALLSALSGALSSARADDSRLSQAQSQLVAPTQVVAPVRASATRPADARQHVDRAAPIAADTPGPALAPPLRTVRLIE